MNGHRVFDEVLMNAVDDELPEGWVLGRIGDILNLVNGFAFKPAHWTNVGLPIIRIQNLNDPTKPHNYCADEIPDRYIVNPGDLLFAWSGTPGTSFGAHIWNGPRALLNQHIFRVAFNERLLEKKFVRLAINHNLDEYIADAQGGVGLAHITKKKFDASHLRIGPLAEQKRIVAKVEALLERVGKARVRLDRVPDIIKRFRQSVLAAACSGRLTIDWRELHQEIEPSASYLPRVLGEGVVVGVPSEIDPVELPEIPDTWAWSRCGEICDSTRALTYGVIKLGPPVDGGVPTLRSSDVRWLHIDNSHVKTISDDIAANFSRTFLQGGEVLVTVRGTLGGVAVVPDSMAGFNISREVAMLPVVRHLNPHYVAFSIASLTSQNWLTEVTKGVAYTGVNIRDLKLLPVAIAPIDEQFEIVRRVNVLLAAADRIQERYLAGAKRTERITQSVLAKAFAGELVETEADLARREGRDYEPASALLERIAAKRAAAENGKPKRRKRH